MNKNKVVENFEKICLNTVPPTPEMFKSHKFSKMWMGQGITVFLSNEDFTYFHDIIKEILTEIDIARNFSIDDIEKSVQDIISRVLKLKTKKGRKNRIIKEVNVYISKLKSQIKDWKFIIPIENFKVSRKFKVGEVELFKFTKYQYSKEFKEYKRLLNSKRHYKIKIKKKLLEYYKKYNLNPLLNSSCALVNVKGTYNGAKQIALKKIDFELSTIKLYGYYNDASTGRYFGIKGEIIPPVSRLITGIRSDGSRTHTLERTGYLFEFELNVIRKKFMKENGFNKLKSLLVKKEKNEFDKRILNAIYWYSKSYDIPETKKVEDKKLTASSHEEVEYFNLGDKYLKLMIAMECLLISGKESKAFNIKTRSSYILTSDKNQRMGLQKYFQKAYETRSKIVHEGGYLVSKSETNKFMNYVQSTIIALIKFRGRWRIKTNEDFYQWCERNRLKDRL